jgi:hypothetical protein
MIPYDLRKSEQYYLLCLSFDEIWQSIYTYKYVS